VIKDKAYVGFGYSVVQTGFLYNFRNSLFQYDPVRNKWQQMPWVNMTDAPGLGYAFGFALGTKAYADGGFWESIYYNTHGFQFVAPTHFYQFSPQ